MSALLLTIDQAATLIDIDRMLVLSRPPVLEEPLRLVRFLDTNGVPAYGITSQRDIDLFRDPKSHRPSSGRSIERTRETLSAELGPLDVAGLTTLSAPTSDHEDELERLRRLA